MAQDASHMDGQYSKKGILPLLAIALTALVLASCSRMLEPHSPPSDQQAHLIVLGERLFHDPALSADGLISCASCHDPERHFTDGKSVSVGAFGRSGTRNAPTLLDVDRLQSFFWDGREGALETAVIQPFTNPIEMGLGSNQELIDRVSSDAAYSKAIRSALGIADNSDITEIHVSQALSAYLRSLTLLNTAVIPHTGSDEPKSTERGRAIFVGKAECAQCHLVENDAAFTDNRMHHTGIGFDEAAGNLSKLTQRLQTLENQSKPLGVIVLSDPQISQLGGFVKTRKVGDIGAFRTPSLRHVAHTAPYMHDGSVNTLPEAVERELYYRGLARGRPLTLTREEQHDLLAYLRSL